MEHAHSVDCDPRPAAPNRGPSAASSWSDLDRSPLPDFTHHIDDLLGTETEPDPLFFVESWTVGVPAATRNFQSRHQQTRLRETNENPWHAFAFSMPPVVIDDGSMFGPQASSTRAGFSAAWKSAYGFGGSAPYASSSTANRQSTHDIPEDSGTSKVAVPLTIEDASHLLGISAAATRKQIKTAYRQLVWRYHPDLLTDHDEQERRLANDRMICLNEAYRLLCGNAATTAN